MEMGAEINGKLIHEPGKAGQARQEPAAAAGEKAAGSERGAP
jgi:hypothetical protein